MPEAVCAICNRPVAGAARMIVVDRDANGITHLVCFRERERATSEPEPESARRAEADVPTLMDHGETTGSNTPPSDSDSTLVDSVIDPRSLNRRFRRLHQQRRLHLLRQLRRQGRHRRRRVVQTAAAGCIAIVAFASGYALRALVHRPGPAQINSTDPSALSDPRTADAVPAARGGVTPPPPVAATPSPAEQAPARTEPAVQAPSEDAPARREEPPHRERPSRQRAPEADNATASDRVALGTALSEWLGSARARDVDRHMRLYLRNVSVFNHERQVSRAAVRAEKQRVFGQADTVELTASEPSITMSRDGNLATMRFRKQYIIAGPKVNRSGEVLQEIVWVRTPDYGWRIYAEREVAVEPRR